MTQDAEWDPAANGGAGGWVHRTPDAPGSGGSEPAPPTRESKPLAPGRGVHDAPTVIRDHHGLPPVVPPRADVPPPGQLPGQSFPPPPSAAPLPLSSAPLSSAPLPSAPPSSAPPPPFTAMPPGGAPSAAAEPPEKSPRPVGILVLIGVVVGLLLATGAVFAGLLLNRTHGDRTVAASVPPSGGTATGSPSDGAGAGPSSQITADDVSGTQSATTTAPAATGTTDPEGRAANDGTTAIDASLADSALAPTAAGVMTEFFTAINNRRLTDAYAKYTPAQRQRMGSYASWVAGYDSTHDDQITLVDLTDLGGGRMIAHIRLRSQQEPAKAPDRRSGCLRWRLAYTLVPASGGRHLIDEVHPDVPGTQQAYSPCT